jgi:hypothetical protein
LLATSRIWRAALATGGIGASRHLRDGHEEHVGGNNEASSLM